jgi:hypothetical protein
VYVIRDMGQFTYSKCNVASLLWFAHVGMRICGGAQILSCSLLVDTNIMLIFQGDFDLSKGFFGGI